MKGCAGLDDYRSFRVTVDKAGNPILRLPPVIYFGGFRLFNMEMGAVAITIFIVVATASFLLSLGMILPSLLKDPLEFCVKKD